MAVLKYYENGEWQKVNAPSAAVTSVNGQTGDVTIEMPEVNYPVTSVNGQTGDVIIDTGADIPISNTAPENPEVGDLWLDTTTGVTEEEGYVASFNGRAGEVVPQDGDYTADMVGLGNVDNVKQYSANNPPPYPVTSVNGQTGDVVTATQYTATIPSEGWVMSAFDYMVKEVQVPGLVADYSIPPDIDVVLSLNDLDADKELIEAFGLISAAITGPDRLSVFCAGDAPSINIPIILRVWE